MYAAIFFSHASVTTQHCSVTTLSQTVCLCHMPITERVRKGQREGNGGGGRGGREGKEGGRDGWRGTDIRRERTYGGSESEGDTEDERMKRYV